MIKITHKDVSEFKKLAKQTWHDQNWHDAMGEKKNEAIEYALSEKEAGAKVKDVIIEAKKYLTNVYISKI